MTAGAVLFESRMTAPAVNNKPSIIMALAIASGMRMV